jgi:hypothetical protein
MSEIQVNTGDLHNGSQALNGASTKIGDAQSRLGRIVGSIGNAYDGQLRAAIEGIMGGSAQTGSRLQNRAVNLGNELISRANGFEVANQATFSSLSNISSQLNGPLPNSGFPSLPSNSDQIKAMTFLGIAGITGTSFASLLTSTFKSINSSLDLLSNKNFSYNAYKEIGRIFNNLAGNKKAGFVGRMDKVGRFIKTSQYMKFGIIPIGLGTLSDVVEGDNLLHAVGSETIEFLLDAGIYFIPYVGAFYLGTKIGMAIGAATAGVLDAAGMHESASNVNDALEYLDFTDRIGDWAATKIGDAISDFIENPPVILDSPIQPASPSRLA